MLEQIILVLMAILFLIVLPILATFKYWNLKPILKYVIGFMWIFYLILAYEVFYPRDSYYINHLRIASGLDFKDNITIKKRFTSLMNSKARYYSCAIFEISDSQKKLFNTLDTKNSNSIKPLDEMSKCSEILNPILLNSSVISFKKVDEKNFRVWGFIKNSNVVFVYYKFLGMSDKN